MRWMRSAKGSTSARSSARHSHCFGRMRRDPRPPMRSLSTATDSVHGYPLVAAARSMAPKPLPGFFRPPPCVLAMSTRDRVYEAIEQHLLQHGYAPTVRELQVMVGLASPSTVHAHLERLERDG